MHLTDADVNNSGGQNLTLIPTQVTVVVSDHRQLFHLPLARPVRHCFLHARAEGLRGNDFPFRY
jgi:hypothetical protein